MYNSIQHFNAIGVKSIEEKIKKFVSDKKDIADLVLGLKEDLFELGRNIIAEVLSDMDDEIRQSKERKSHWEIVRKDSSSLLTIFGNVEYSTTYFKPKKGGRRKYLVDEMVGINPHDKVSSDVDIYAIEESIDSSYRKGGEKSSFDGIITKQSVMNKIHDIEVPEVPVNKSEKTKIKVLYVEADEDHVALQSKNKNDKKSILMPKLIYVHEGKDWNKSTSKRTVLKNVRYFGGNFESEELWLKVANYIYENYEEEVLETVYISGDGASWIKQGLHWINKSKFVLDNYHLNKYIKRATAHLADDRYYYLIKDALEFPDKTMLKQAFKKILDITESDTKKESIKDARRYMLNNWSGIEIKSDKWYEIFGCSAEGHISHIFSQRLSSRPKGWSKIGAGKMAELLVYKSNGGKIYDLVMAQKIKRKKEEKVKIQDEIIRSLKNSSNRYDNALDTKITAIQIGRKTGLYKHLRKHIGSCG